MTRYPIKDLWWAMINSRLAGNIFGEKNDIASSEPISASLETNVARAANEALSYLRARDEFWKQVEMGAKSVPPMIASNRLDFAKLN